jgi:hypothetical protein
MAYLVCNGERVRRASVERALLPPHCPPEPHETGKVESLAVPLAQFMQLTKVPIVV